MVMKMQNVILTGILLTSLLGSGAVVGYAAMNGHEGMHYWMHGTSHVDCEHFEDCEYDHEECEAQYEEECLEDHGECMENQGHMRGGC
jgi:hypothetical protein